MSILLYSSFSYINVHTAITDVKSVPGIELIIIIVID